jgi:hypothetical protein
MLVRRTRWLAILLANPKDSRCPHAEAELVPDVRKRNASHLATRTTEEPS